ncbi:MAG: hypothetical protein NVSMB62_02780 [Acidobacteriaceae bacterium]
MEACGELGRKHETAFLEAVYEGGRDRSPELLVRGSTAVATVTEKADFVLHLHHEHCLIRGINIFDMLEKRGEGPAVAPLSLIAEGRENFGRLTIGRNGAWEAVGVALHPCGRVARESVLPTAEP